MIFIFKKFISGFLNRDGFHILYATILARILSFFASWIALQLIPNYELGLVIYSINIISLIIPISGFGASQGLLRYGALLETDEEKNNLFTYVLKKGSVFSVVLIVIVILFSSLLTNNLSETRAYLIAISFSIITLFLLESIKVQFRILHKNKLFAKTEISFNVLLVVMVFLGSYYFKENGYVAALIIAPLLTFLIYLPKIKFRVLNSSTFQNPDLDFWKYSFFTSLSNVASQLLIVLDIVLIGNILKDPEIITIYKYVSLIPISILFLPRVLLTTDFVTLTKNHRDKTFIKNYIKNYLFLFLSLSVFIILFSFLFSEFFLGLFGEEFKQYTLTFRVLIIGITAILILRGLYGNLLSAIGKAYINYWISIIAIVINLISNYILIPKYGILGAAITSAIIMWVTSVLSVVFYNYHKNK